MRGTTVKRERRDVVWKKKVKPRLSEIREWLGEQISKAEICRRLNVASETMRRIAMDEPELEKIWRSDIAVWSDRRTCVYENFVAGRLHDIEKWIRNGATIQQICEQLDITTSQWYRFIQQYEDLVQAVETGRKDLSSELRGVLAKKALGYEYTEKTVKTTANGGVETIEYHKVAHPDVKAIEALLRNYDSEWKMPDGVSGEMKAEKHELEKQVLDSKIW